jgi:hypothetical protein
LLLAGLRSEAFCADDYTRGQSGWALVPTVRAPRPAESLLVGRGARTADQAVIWL